MRKIFTTLIASLISLSLPLSALADDAPYPFKTLYPKGIASADSSLFLNSKIKKPIETGFEERNDFTSLKTDTQSGELSITEDAYSGKFALEIQKSQDSIIPICETDYFQTGCTASVGDRVIIKKIAGIQVEMDDKSIFVSGTKASNEEVSILVKKDDTITYIDQKTADENGSYSFTFPLPGYGTYQLSVGGSASEATHTTFELTADQPAKPTTPEASSPTGPHLEIGTKCNLYNVMLKPMYQSETISFYVKVKTQDESGNIKEQYALIKSDKNGDGIYKVGEDLSRGKWQKVQLSLSNIDTSLQNGSAAGLYMNANQGSEWLLDDISSGYRKINEKAFDLSNFASGNVVYTGDSLRFSNNTDSDDYNIGSRVVSGGMNVSDQLSEIHVDSRLQFSSNDATYHEDLDRQILYTAPLEEDTCLVNSENYDLGKIGTSKKVSKIYLSNDVPSIPPAYMMTISDRPETEKRFRLILKPVFEDAPLYITDQSGVKKDYVLSQEYEYTDWYTGDITLSTTLALARTFSIYAIEYELTEDTAQDILMRNQGSVVVDLGNLTTDDRTTLTYDLEYDHDGYMNTQLLLEFFEGNAETPYYATNAFSDRLRTKTTLSHIVPKIKANTRMKITNLVVQSTYDELRLSDIKFAKTHEQDWNKRIEYADYGMLGNWYNLNLPLGSSFKKQAVSDLYSEENQYAVVYPNAVGMVNAGATTATFETSRWDNEYEFSIYRILNLSTEPVCAMYNSYPTSNASTGTPIALHYGLSDYVTPGKGYLGIPANPNVMLLAISTYTHEKIDTSPVHHTVVDGLYQGTFIENENAIIYPNVYENQNPYKYDLDTKTRQRLSADILICASPDGTHLLLKDMDENYYILNRVTTERTPISLDLEYQQCFFSPDNELFIRTASELYYYTDGTFQYMASISSTYKNYDFDSSGEYLLLTFNTGVTLYKKTNRIWNPVISLSKTTSLQPEKALLSKDSSCFYLQARDGKIYSVDLNTLTKTFLLSGGLMQVTDNNMLLIAGSNRGTCLDYVASDYYLYNLVTGETHKMFNDRFVYDFMFYNAETNMVIGLLPHNRVIYHHFVAEKPEAKYALSFDGQDNWLVYSGGRWLTISKDSTPSAEEMRLSGMTAETVNNIPSSAYEKLYKDNCDILTVDMAIYMYSDSKNQTPVIEDIIVKTIEKDDFTNLYGIHMEKYDKADYRSIKSLFPIENFGSDAECYYLLYIGNDWLYTYKNNELIKVEESADPLLADMSESWITFKQYGMTAQELRHIPGDVLSQLFVNEDYANTEFGVIYVVKAKDDTTNYTVTFRLSSSSNFTIGEDIVVEIIMNGGDVKVIDSMDFSVADIENLLSWIEARQNGSGEIFYRLKNEKIQHFINYYMINSISVYSGEEYRTKATK